MIKKKKVKCKTKTPIEIQGHHANMQVLTTEHNGEKNH
jgi:hypothetical protein